MARAAIDLVLSEPERFVMEDEERAEYERLAVFLGLVATEPRRFPVTGAMATKVKRIVRGVTGPAQPKPLNKRKARQERRMRTHKARRRQRKEIAAQFNEARERIEAEMKEMEAAHAERQARLDKAAKFDILGPDGTVIVQQVPESFIRRVEGDGPPLSEPAKNFRRLLHLPGKVEKQMERDAA